jgi:RNA polymerase sigma-70 factor (ECF subfamily)
MEDSRSWKSDAGEAFAVAAMDELFVIHRAGLLRFVAGVVHNHQAAEDVVQSTFAKALRAGPEVPPEAMKSWLYRVAFNEAVTWKRKHGVDRRATQELWEQGNAASEGPEEPLVRRETIRRVRMALQELPQPQRQVVLARMERELTFAQIAAEMGLPLGTVLTHMRRALEKLRKKLD